MALVGLGALTFAGRAHAQAIYTWNKTGSAEWGKADSWSPQRSSVSSTDILIFDGAVTPAPTATKVKAETVRQLRIINGANVTLTTDHDGTLALAGGSGPNLEVGPGASLARSGGKKLHFSLSGTATASIFGAMSVEGQDHQFLAASAGAIVFHAGASFTTLNGFNTNAFGNSGTANTVIFQSGSSYIHNVGRDVFGLGAPAAKVVFLPGSEAVFRKRDNVTCSGRTYANIRLENNCDISTSGSLDFQFDSLYIEDGSRLVHQASGSGRVLIRGGINSEGSEETKFKADGGFIWFNGGHLQTIRGGGSGRVKFDSHVFVTSGTTLRLMRKIEFGGGDQMNVDGAIQLSDGAEVKIDDPLIYGSSGKLIFDMTAPYTVTGADLYWPDPGPRDVTVQGSGTVTLDVDRTVPGTLALTAGRIATGSNVLTVATGGTVTRVAGYVDGFLRKGVPTGNPLVTFEIGTTGGYTPAVLQFSGVTTAGTITASTIAGDHPNLASSGIIPTKSVNRYHRLTPSGLAFASFDGTFFFLPSEVDAGANPADFYVQKYDASTWTGGARGAVSDTSVQILGQTSFGDFAIGEVVSHTITASAGTGGSIVPSGAVPVPDRTTFTFIMVADPNNQVDSVFVDGSYVGMDTSYTFSNVTGNHTISVVFGQNTFFVDVTVSGGGTYGRDIPGPYQYGQTVRLTAFPDVGQHFVDWTLVDLGGTHNANNPLDLTVIQDHHVIANFVREPLSYTRTTFSAPYAPITEAGGASRLMSGANDSTRTIPMPFSFVYSGLRYTTGNYLAVNANGFMFPWRTPLNLSFSSHANNINLYSAISPNNTIAPWYDDLNVAIVGTNPAGLVLYQTQGTPGSRTLTVQWTNVSSFSNTAGGQPRQINFQAVLYEGTNVIEFRYGPISGAGYSTLESAAIGLEDSTGGGNYYIDGITGSRVTNNGMLTTNKWPQRFIRFTPGTPQPLAAGTYDVGVGQTYASLTDAVADVNQRGVDGPVTLRLMDAVYDSSSAGGGNIFPILLAPIEGTSQSNTVTIEAASGTAELRYRGTESGYCGNQTITVAIGSSNEPILGLVGTDDVILRNVSLKGGPTVDRGLLLIPSSSSDGARSNTFENLSVSLDRANLSSVGIQQIVSTTPSQESGTNSSNRYLNLDVSNVYAGVSLAGHSSLLDSDCEVGVVNGGATTIGGSTAGDIGNGSSQTFGIRATNQAGVRIYGAEVRNVRASGTSTVDGILVDNLSGSGLSSGACEIFDNDVHGLANTSTSAGVVSGIRVDLTSHPSSASRIYNNFVYGLNSSSTSTITRRLIGINIQPSGNGFGATHNVDFNSVQVAPSQAIAPNSCFEIGTATGPVMNVRNNVFANFVGTQQGSGKHYCWVTPSGNAIGAPGSVSNHNVLHINNLSNGFVGQAGGNDKPLLADWQAVAGSDVSSSTANPEYSSDTDLHINPNRPTPVESKGSYFGGAIDWVTQDIDGDARDGTFPDIGADEGAFVLQGNVDVSATAFVEPPAGSFKLAGASFSPQVTFANSGILGQVSIPVRFRISGPDPSTTVVYDETAVIPILDPGVSQTVTFPSTSVAVSGLYTMTAISELVGDDTPLNDTLSAALEIAGPLSGTYPIGSAQSAPFNTLSDAIGRLGVVGVSGPVTFLLEDAAYSSETLPINIDPIPGATSLNTFTIKPAPGVQPLISGATTRAVIQLNGCDYVILDGSNVVDGTTRDLTIENTSPVLGTAVIWGQTASGDGVTHVTVKNLTAKGYSNAQTLVGIGFGGTTISPMSNGAGNHENWIENCKVMRTQYGICSGGASTANKNIGTVIKGNSIDAPAPDNVSHGGILLRFENGPLVTENRVAEIVTADQVSPFGIAMGLTFISSQSFAGDEVTNAVVTRNAVDRIVSTHPNGLSAAGITIVEAHSGITTVANNMVSRVLSPALDPDMTVGILAGGGSGSTTRIYFNSVSMTGNRGAAPGASLALAIGGSNPTVDARDNVLYNTQTATPYSFSYAIGLAYFGPYTGLTSNYNDLYVSSAPLAVVGGLANSDFDVPALADWRTTTGKDLNSRSSDPLFVSDQDLHITQSGSPVANVGSPIAGVTIDFDGEPGLRSSTPDMGADEFGTHTLNVAVVGVGTVAKAPDLPNYATGSTVELTATPGAAYHFVGWSGDASGTDNPLQVVMDHSKSITSTFALDTYPVDVTVVGEGSVAKDPNQATYAHGSTVQLTATPDAGYHFVGWSGDTSDTTNPLSITVVSARNITATFDINTYTLDVASSGNGTVAKDPDQADYTHGTTVSVTGTPDPGYHLESWSGDASGSDDPLQVLMDANKSITGNFAINTYALTVDTVGSGSVVKNPDQPDYTHGTPVTLTAVPDSGYRFVDWSGDTASSDNPISVTMNAAKTIVATFERDVFTVAVDTVGRGSVAKNPDMPDYPRGSTVQLTANPAPGFAFVEWAGDTTGTANPISIPLYGNRNITAVFSTELTVSVVGNGTVTKNPDQASYAPGSTVELTATPDGGHSFVGWAGDTSDTANPITITMNDNRNIVALFTTSLDVAVVGSGSVAKFPDQPNYAPGSLVELNAMPGVGYSFVAWSGDTTSSANPLLLPMTGNRSVTATFAINYYTLSLAVVGNGSVSKDPDLASYAAGDTVLLTPTPEVGYHFVAWSGDASGSDVPLALEMDGDKNVTATFAINSYPLVVDTVGSGSVVKTPDQPTYDHGTQVLLTPVPGVGYHFAGWSGDTATAAESLLVVMDQAKNITATFEINTYPLTVSTVGNGTVAKIPDQPEYDHGIQVLLVAAPGTGYHFAGWSGDTTAAAESLLVVMDQAKSVTATFTINSYALAVDTVGSGTVAKDPDQPTYTHGSQVTLTATPGDGYHFLAWGGDASGSANPVVVTMDTAKTVTATFEINSYALVVDTVGSGTVAKDPDQPLYEHGSNVTVTAVPDTGYHFVAWSGDASGSANPLVVTMDAAKSITATFDLNAYSLDVSAVGGGYVSVNPSQALYTHGSAVVLTAVPDTGYHFVSWSGDASGSDNPLSLIMDGNKDITATFEINTYALDVTITGDGSVSKDPDQAVYDHGTEVLLTATPVYGNHFVSWTGSDSGYVDVLSVTMDEPKSILATFAVNTYPLNVTVVGSGSVDKNPDQPAYDHGSVVQLIATPGVGYHFFAWGGDTTAVGDTLSVPMYQARSIFAYFEVNTYPLDVAVVGSGSVDKNPDQAEYDHGSVVQLTAIPGVGFHFTGWTGDTTAATDTLSVVVDQPKSLTATFEINSYPLDVAVVGNGTVMKDPDQALYEHGTVVTLTVMPGPEYYFQDWTGDTSEVADTLVVVMNGAKNYTATFSNAYHAIVKVLGSGAVIPLPDQPSYDYGQEILLLAEPDQGYHFAGWTGDTVYSSSALQLTMYKNWNLTANFELSEYALDLTVVGGGTVLRNPDLPTYPHGTTVELTAVPDSGSHFVRWSGDADGVTSPVTVLMDGDRSATATFWTNTYTVDVVPVGGSLVVGKFPDQPTYDPGTKVDLTAMPDSGYRFVHYRYNPTDTVVWNPMSVTTDSNLTIYVDLVPGPPPTFNLQTVGGGHVFQYPDTSGNPEPNTWFYLTAVTDSGYVFQGWSGTGLHPSDVSRTYLPLFHDRDRDLTATFLATSLTLDVSVVGGGSVAKNPDLPSYAIGTTVELTAVPDSGFYFVGWSGDTTATSNPLPVAMNDNKSITAIFGHALNVATVGEGTVTKIPDQPVYAPGTEVLLVAHATTTYLFTDWSGDTIGVADSLTVAMDRNWNITATFQPRDRDLTVLVVGNGSVSLSPDQDSYDNGTSVTLTAIPAKGWHFVEWVDGPSEIGQEVPSDMQHCNDCGSLHSNPRTILMQGSRTVTARFEIDTYVLDVTIVGDGTVTRDPDQPRYDYLSTVVLVATPGVGQAFVGWSGDTAAASESLLVVMDRPKSVTATFQAALQALVVDVEGAGVVTTSTAPSTESQVDIARLEAKPESGWRFLEWSGDASGSENPLLLALDGAKRVRAVFVEAMPPVVRLKRADGARVLILDSSARLEWTAEDNVGVTGIDLLISRDPRGETFEKIAENVPNSGAYLWQVAGPGSWDGVLRVVARDAAGNVGMDTLGVAILTEDQARPVTEFALDPMSPNPSSGPTRIAFALPREARVRLAVLDVQGREMASLADGVYRAGRHELVWDGRNGRGTAPAGVYFVRFQAPGRNLVRRLVISR